MSKLINGFVEDGARKIKALHFPYELENKTVDGLYTVYHLQNETVALFNIDYPISYCCYARHEFKKNSFGQLTPVCSSCGKPFKQQIKDVDKSSTERNEFSEDDLRDIVNHFIGFRFSSSTELENEINEYIEGLRSFK